MFLGNRCSKEFIVLAPYIFAIFHSLAFSDMM